MGIRPMPMMPHPDSPKKLWDEYHIEILRLQSGAGLKLRLSAIATGLSIGLGLALWALLK